MYLKGINLVCISALAKIGSCAEREVTSPILFDGRGARSIFKDVLRRFKYTLLAFLIFTANKLTYYAYSLKQLLSIQV